MVALALAPVPAAATSYTIDPSQSYIKAYTQNWSAYDYTAFYANGPGTSQPTSTVVWTMQYSLATFALSGGFDVTEEPSPYGAGVSHLTLANAALQDFLPTAVYPFSLPSLLTYFPSSGHVARYDPLSDPFYLNYGTCVCISTQPNPTASGSFNGGLLNLSGASGAIGPTAIMVVAGFGSYVPIADPGPPPADLVAQFNTPYSYTSYQLVAQAVPEPETYSLMAAGLALVAFMGARRTKQ
jgi:hypothetical protein